MSESDHPAAVHRYTTVTRIIWRVSFPPISFLNFVNMLITFEVFQVPKVYSSDLNFFNSDTAFSGQSKAPVLAIKNLHLLPVLAFLYFSGKQEIPSGFSIICDHFNPSKSPHLAPVCFEIHNRRYILLALTPFAVLKISIALSIKLILAGGVSCQLRVELPISFILFRYQG